MRLSLISLAMFVVGAVGGCSGCGGAHYAQVINGAASRIEEARAVGAEELAPYEYYCAKDRIEQAEVVASEASHSQAANLAREAEQYANTAIVLAQMARPTSP